MMRPATIFLGQRRLGDGLSRPQEDPLCEKVNSSTGSLQVSSVNSFALQHHPDNVHHLTAKTDKRLRL